MDPDDLAFAGLARQAALVRGGEVSARELLEAVLARIARLDPRLNAFRVVRAEAARAEAAAADARRDGPLPPLLGVPVAVKDDTDVAGEVTALGTDANERPAERDAEVVARLRRAGAVIVGKTHVPELTQWPFTESATYGVTRNPWDLRRSPGGSSGGSAAAVAAGLAGAALGSDGAGSVRLPAACCGLFGCKPQRGRLPLAPRRDVWHGLGHLGPLTRTVADAALFLDATADGPRPAGGFAAAAATPPAPLRVAVSTAPPPGLPVRVGAEQRAAVARTAAALRDLGHRVHERDPDYTPALVNHVTARYLRGVHDERARLERPGRVERRTARMARLGGLLPPALVRRVRAGEAAHAARLGALFAHADVLLTPALPADPFPVGHLEGRGALATLMASARIVAFLGAWNATGQPAAAVPAGRTRAGLPVAVQLVARPHDEATLLALAAQLEAARPWAGARPAL
jgi:amidase